MNRIIHLFDETFDWQQRVAFFQLLDRLPRDRFSHRVATLNPTIGPTLRSMARPVHVVRRWAGLNALAAALFSRWLAREPCDVIHAWGPHAAAVAAMAAHRPLIVELFDPTIAHRNVKLFRTIARPRDFALVCSCDRVRRRLIEGGVPAAVCVTVRPGVDFAVVNRIKNSTLRQQLGIAANDYVILPGDAPDNENASLESFWAGALLNHLSGNVKVLVPNAQRNRSRIARFAATMPSRPTIVLPDPDIPFDELIPIADAMVIASDADVSTTAVAWAMASKTAVLAAAGYAVTELIANKVNGLLFKRIHGKSAVVPLAKLIEDRPNQAKAKETAHGQAFEVFGLRRCIEQHERVYENVLAGRAVDDAITDTARVG